MRFLSLLLFLLSLYSCQSGEPGGIVKIDSSAETKEPVDTVKTNRISEFKAKSKNSPVDLVSSQFISKGSGRIIQLTFKNSSNKTVDGIMWTYVLLNNFGHNISDAEFGVNGGATQKLIKPNQSVTVSAKVTQEATGIKDFSINQVHYTDGSTWEIKE